MIQTIGVSKKYGELEVLKNIDVTIESEKITSIIGASGAGKTTLLRALLLECQNQRVIALEDVAELGPAGPNFISLQTRQPNLEGKGEIDLQVLLREALRMRPDRIALGEVRGRRAARQAFGLATQVIAAHHAIDDRGDPPSSLLRQMDVEGAAIAGCVGVDSDTRWHLVADSVFR